MWVVILLLIWRGKLQLVTTETETIENKISVLRRIDMEFEKVHTYNSTPDVWWQRR